MASQTHPFKSGSPHGSLIVPLFPLPGVVLFPGCVMPLRIFEPRYRTMLQDAVAPGSQQLIAMAHIRERAKSESEPAGLLLSVPAVHDVLGIGRVIANDEQPDGTYNIALLGEARCRIEEEIPHSPYRLARVTSLHDDTPGTPELRNHLERSRAELLSAAQALIGRTLVNEAAESLISVLKERSDAGSSSDLLASVYVHDAGLRQALLEMLDVLKRTQLMTAILTKILSGLEPKPPPSKYGAGDYSLN